MPRLKLTAAAVDRIKPPDTGQIEYFDTVLPSFFLRVSYSGTKAWGLMTRIDKKLVRLTLGRHPMTSLGDARAKARAALELAERGVDPRKVAETAKHEAEARATNTFGSLAAEFMEKHVRPNLRKSTAREYHRTLTGPDTAHWRDVPVADIRKRDVIDLVETIAGRGKPGAARLALAYLRRFFNWCVEREVIEHAPTDRVKVSVKLPPRERVLLDSELSSIRAAFEAAGYPFGPMFMVMLLTGQRRGEVAGMRWEEIRDLDGDAALWEIPGHRTKNHRAHLVPLSQAVQQVLTSLPRMGSFVFTTTGSTPVSGFSRAKARIDRWLAEKADAGEIDRVDAWTLHDLRRTMVTQMNERLGVPPHVVEAVVNHVSGSAKAGVAGVYNRALYLDDRRDALDRWARYVTDVGNHRDGSRER